MHVYRLCSKEEVDTILATHDFSTIGKECYNKNNLNTNNYEYGKKYLHFFLQEYQLSRLRSNKEYYVCTYDIPEEIIIQHIGRGYYKNKNDLSKLDTVAECAIENTLISYENLVKIEKPTKSTHFENYQADISNLKEIVYDRKDAIKIKRR